MKIIFSLLITLAFILGCGVKGGPYPPLSEAPETVKNAKIKQQDKQMVVYWNYLPSYEDGRRMNERFRFEIYGMEYRIIKSVKNKGNLYWFRYEFNEEREYCFRFKVKTRKNESRYSKYFCYIPTFNYPKESPKINISIVEEGLRIKWDRKDMKVNIYRNSSRLYYPLPYTVVQDKRQYLDKNVVSGSKYCYYLTYENKDGVESKPSDIKCAVFKDIFPPLPPENPKILKRNGVYYLVWSESRSSDVIGYIITVNNIPLTNIPIKTYVFKIKKLKSEDEIKIYAVDKAGNKSSPAILRLSSEQP